MQWISEKVTPRLRRRLIRYLPFCAVFAICLVVFMTSYNNPLMTSNQMTSRFLTNSTADSAKRPDRGAPDSAAEPGRAVGGVMSFYTITSLLQRAELLPGRPAGRAASPKVESAVNLHCAHDARSCLNRPVSVACWQARGTSHNSQHKADERSADGMQFDAMDADHDGKISRSEWIADEDSIDTNHDGVISRSEWMAAAARNTNTFTPETNVAAEIVPAPATGQGLLNGSGTNSSLPANHPPQVPSTTMPAATQEAVLVQHVRTDDSIQWIEGNDTAHTPSKPLLCIDPAPYGQQCTMHMKDAVFSCLSQLSVCKALVCPDKRETQGRGELCQIRGNPQMDLNSWHDHGLNRVKNHAMCRPKDGGCTSLFFTKVLLSRKFTQHFPDTMLIVLVASDNLKELQAHVNLGNQIPERITIDSISKSAGVSLPSTTPLWAFALDLATYGLK